MRKYTKIIFHNCFKDDSNDNEDITGDGWKGPWKYRDMPLEDHFSLQIFQTSRLLDKITGLQVTSPDMKGKELDIPISLNDASLLNAASDDLRVSIFYIF